MGSLESPASGSIRDTSRLCAGGESGIGLDYTECRLETLTRRVSGRVKWLTELLLRR